MEKAEVWLSPESLEEQASSIAGLVCKALRLVGDFVTIEGAVGSKTGAKIKINGQSLAILKVVYCPNAERPFLRLEDDRPELAELW